MLSLTDIAATGQINSATIHTNNHAFNAAAFANIRARNLTIIAAGINLVPAAVVQADTVDLQSDGSLNMAAVLTGTKNLTVSNGSFTITDTIALDSLKVTGYASVIGASTIIGTPGETFAFGTTGSDLNLDTTTSHQIALNVHVNDFGINAGATGINTLGGNLILSANTNVSVGTISTVSTTAGSVSINTLNGSILKGGAGSISSGTSAVTLVAGNGSVGNAAGNLLIHTGGAISASIWAGNEVNVDVVDASVVPSNLSTLLLGVNGSGTGNIHVGAANLPGTNFLTRSGGNLSLAAVPAAPGLNNLTIVGRDGNLTVAGDIGTGGTLNSVDLISAGALTANGDVTSSGFLELRAGSTAGLSFDANGIASHGYSFYNGSGDLVIQPASGTRNITGGQVNLLAGGNVVIGQPTASGAVVVGSSQLLVESGHGDIRLSGGNASGGTVSITSSSSTQNFNAANNLLIASGTATGTGVTISNASRSQNFTAGNALTLQAGNDVLSITGGSQTFSSIGNMQILGGGSGGSVNIASTSISQQFFSGNDLIVTTGTAAGSGITLAAGTGAQFLNAGHDLSLTAQAAALSVTGGYQRLTASHNVTLTSGTTNAASLNVIAASSTQRLSANTDLILAARNAALNVTGAAGQTQSLTAGNNIQISGGGVNGSAAVTGAAAQFLQASNGILVESGTDATASVTVASSGLQNWFASGASGMTIQAQAATVAVTSAAQSFFSVSAAMNFFGGSSTNASVDVHSTGSQSLFSGRAINLSGGVGANAFALVRGDTGQSVTAASLALAAGSGSNAKAQLTGATQNINVTGLTALTGGSGSGATADIFSTATHINSGSLLLIAGSGGGVGIGSVAGDGAGLVTIDNGALVDTSAVSVAANNFTLSSGGVLFGPQDLSITVAGAMTINSGSGVGAYGSVSLTSTEPVLVDGGFIGADNAIAIVAGELALNHGGYIGSFGNNGVTVAATNVRLDNGSSIVAFAPAANVEMVIGGGDLTLDNGSHVKAGNDVLLTLSGTDALVVVNAASGESVSTIEAGSRTSTRINFFGRTSGGVVIDGENTTTTTFGGSGFYAAGSPAFLNDGLEITYGSTSNPATQLIDQFFANLTKPKYSKNKKTDDDEDKENNNDGVGQCS